MHQRGHGTSPALFFGDHESPNFLASQQRRGLGTPLHVPLVAAPWLRAVSPRGLPSPAGRATIPGPPFPGHPRQGERRLPSNEGAGHDAPSPPRCRVGGGWGRGQRGQGHAKVTQGRRARWKRGNRNEAGSGTSPARGLPPGFAARVLPNAGRGVLKKPPATKIRSLCPRVQRRGPRPWDPKHIAAIQPRQLFRQGIIFPCPPAPAPGHPRGWEMGTGTGTMHP